MSNVLDMPVRIVRRKKQKRLHIQAKTDHYLVSAPKRLSNREIEAFIRDNHAHIQSLRRTLDPETALYPSSTLDVFGVRRPLKVEYGEERLILNDGHYLFFTRKQKEHTIKEALKKTLKTILIEALNTLHDEYRQIHPTVCDRPITFKTRYLKSRFGSAIPAKRTIMVNLVFVHYDSKLLHYIYAHEMAHFINPDHSQAFYTTLSGLVSDHEALKQTLRQTHTAYTTVSPRLQ